MKIEWEHNGDFIHYNNCCVFADNRCRGVVTFFTHRKYIIIIDGVEESFEGDASQAKRRAEDIITGASI